MDFDKATLEAIELLWQAKKTANQRLNDSRRLSYEPHQTLYEVAPDECSARAAKRYRQSIKKAIRLLRIVVYSSHTVSKRNGNKKAGTDKE